uniref:Uncharacterized protein n=1 Tax=Oncorhynchus tshawytscha TaxID=74940 RepID=A0A8C8MJY1_ONCTS
MLEKSTNLFSPSRSSGRRSSCMPLRKHHEEEIDHSKKEIERLQREIACHKGNIKKLKHDD